MRTLSATFERFPWVSIHRAALGLTPRDPSRPTFETRTGERGLTALLSTEAPLLERRQGRVIYGLQRRGGREERREERESPSVRSKRIGAMPLAPLFRAIGREPVRQRSKGADGRRLMVGGGWSVTLVAPFHWVHWSGLFPEPNPGDRCLGGLPIYATHPYKWTLSSSGKSPPVTLSSLANMSSKSSGSPAATCHCRSIWVCKKEYRLEDLTCLEEGI